MLEAGVPVHAAQAHLGHADPQTTIGIYTHVRKGTVEAAGDRIEEFRRQRKLVR
jgi:integrase